MQKTKSSQDPDTSRCWPRRRATGAPIHSAGNAEDGWLVSYKTGHSPSDPAMKLLGIYRRSRELMDAQKPAHRC